MENCNTAASELISSEDLKRWEAEKWQRQWRVLTESQAIEEMQEIFKHSFDGNIPIPQGFRLALNLTNSQNEAHQISLSSESARNKGEAR